MITAGRTVPVHGRGEYDEDLDEWADTEVFEVPDLMVFHWSPAARRKQIIRYGLRPRMRHTTHSDGWRAPYICFADSPSWAWALSGQMDWAPAGEWDLWQTWLSDIGSDIDPGTDVEIIPDPSRQSGMHEIRTKTRVPKSRLWHVGTRTKPA